MGTKPRECVPEQPVRHRWAPAREWGLLAALTVGVLIGAGLWFAGRRGAADGIWAAATVAALAPAAWSTLRQVWRRQFGWTSSLCWRWWARSSSASTWRAR